MKARGLRSDLIDAAVGAAERIVAERLRDYAPPPFEPERREAPEALVARRKAEGGAPTDF